ncbi:class I SAM-dependent methyltransferase [Sedimentimonas flavescens]|uniref:class I SAM-dependent methyltransferase n=1 Tax=Sedimentimonas flavescens TaxID=2851012 RepID=UPI002E29DE6B|nr:class I SAM-dependent methyltransferase [Sedimentimonas flavescens]
MARRPQRKYLNRKTNIRRAMNRVSLFLPELMSGKPQRILELSTAHGAILEVLRHYGHKVVGNDYVNMVSGETQAERAIYRDINDQSFSRAFDDYGLPVPSGGVLEDWPYRPIIESINIPMQLFDAGITPYPVETASFDYVISMQAIEHYCHPRDWLKIVDEMCRISRRSVFLLLNPMMPEMAADPHYSEAFHTAREALRDYDQNGFRCVGCHLHWGQALGFKLMST